MPPPNAVQRVLQGVRAEVRGVGETYGRAGVSLAAGQKVVEAARLAARSTLRPEVVAGIGGFGALLRLPRGYRRPLLVGAADGVGTKLRVAFMARRHDTIGIDLVAMNVNDILTLGAEPLAFLDYFAAGKLQPKVAAEVLRGIARGCRLAGCSLIGGETAELPSFYAPGEYDLAGFAIGVVEERAVIDGSRIRPGDVVIGLASSGLHSNGYSLVRRLCFDKARLSLRAQPPELGRPLVEELLEPTRIYVRSVRALPLAKIKGMAHITGGGLLDNLPRILPSGCEAIVRPSTWRRPGVFDLLVRLGRLQRSEAFRTFNMGIGFALVVGSVDAADLLSLLRKRGEKARIIGEIRRGRQPRVVLD